ncbi:MAG TPA: methylenetetrahydrofolate reductase, partial [Thermoleophilaceae bacterium]|nr:methylenetetrahydrofolate reductase [Thermoleophilaceae bacterium]
MGASASRLARRAGLSHPAVEEESRARAIAELLRRPRYEVLPFEETEEQVATEAGTDARITVTSSPSRGLEATLDLSERLARRGYDVIPHLAARLVRDRSQLDEILDRLSAAGVRRLFVPAGDRSIPCGEFEDAVALLAAMGSRRGAFDEIGITGYPESHHLIPDEVTIRAMFDKSEMATDIVSQICFEAETIAGWIRDVRERGTDLPIWIGLPGVVGYRKLARISAKIGLGESARFLTHQHGAMSHLLTHRFSPDGLVRELGPTLADPSTRVAGFHL